MNPDLPEDLPLPTTALQVAELIPQCTEFLSQNDEFIAERDFAMCVDAWVEVGTLNVPLSLRHFNTQIIEVFNANWSDTDILIGSVMPYLENFCNYWENVYNAHEAALSIFRGVNEGQPGYCLYLRSFEHVFHSDIDLEETRAVIYFNNEALDRNVAHALAAEAFILKPIACLHPDDMALLEGKWLLPSFRVHDHDWKKILSEAIRSGKIIVFYLGASSQGTEFELEEIRRMGLLHRTILVYEHINNLPADVAEFADNFSLTEFVKAGEDPMKTRLTSKAKKRLTELSTDKYNPPVLSDLLFNLPCNVVDPRVPIELPKNIDPAKTICITPDNLTAFAWYMTGLPNSMIGWNRIDRKLYEKKQSLTVKEVNNQLRNVTMACLGASSIGLTASISGAIGLRVITCNLVMVPDLKKKAKRKEAFLNILDIADRFDDLTLRRFWHARNNMWRSAIMEDIYT
jgi:hypothetical protein